METEAPTELCFNLNRRLGLASFSFAWIFPAESAASRHLADLRDRSFLRQGQASFRLYSQGKMTIA